MANLCGPTSRTSTTKTLCDAFRTPPGRFPAAPEFDPLDQELKKPLSTAPKILLILTTSLMTNQKLCAILIPEAKNNYFTERKRIMKNFVFAYEYACQAVFCSEEYGCAKHTYIKISKKAGLD